MPEKIKMIIRLVGEEEEPAVEKVVEGEKNHIAYLMGEAGLLDEEVEKFLGCLVIAPIGAKGCLYIKGILYLNEKIY